MVTFRSETPGRCRDVLVRSHDPLGDVAPGGSADVARPDPGSVGVRAR
jgi:hypothetical protein